MALPNRSCLVNSTCPPMQRTDLPYPSAASLMGRGPHGLVGWEADLFFPSPQCEVLRDCSMIHNPIGKEEDASGEDSETKTFYKK